MSGMGLEGRVSISGRNTRISLFHPLFNGPYSVQVLPTTPQYQSQDGVVIYQHSSYGS
jgi:hypothetical protein